MKITILTVGKLKEDYLREGCSILKKKIEKRHSVTIIEVPDEKTPPREASALQNAAIEKEGLALAQKIPPDSYVIALCIRGKNFDTPAWKEKFRQYQKDGISHLCFIIGGSMGLSPTVEKSAKERISISPMTFPHQLMRLVLLELLSNV